MAGEKQPEEHHPHHPEGVVESDSAYRQQAKEKILTGVTVNRVSLVTVFANALQELQIPAANVGPAGYTYRCGCAVRFQGNETTISVCEGHR